MKKTEGWMYLSPEGRLVKPVVQSLLPHKLVDGELVLQPLTKGGVPPMKPLGFERSFDRAGYNFLQLLNCHVGQSVNVQKIEMNLGEYTNERNIYNTRNIEMMK